ncbi:PIN domain-containing protein [Brotaphodocola catenula]|uniref:PIN domain-containing protein n=1 Tax=Brotaphodocola catenula TaxID=2885361 RepID=A0AAE3DIU5_9FIRM|nr:PIN domain-containing protein [Brotaphodocola catenula]MCC2163487.1 PIN domain-containing protein [Brotaphodocola catenula]
MKRTYLIDSENINDVWVEILDALEIGDCIMVFFTDKSAHMGYDRIVRLMELEKGTVKWIRCFGGQNALDFQLVTELGHQICQDQECEYVIVSNDTGYDSVVRYWQQRGCSVSRIKGMECTKLASRMKKQRQEEPCISIFLKKKTFGEVTPEAVNSEVVSSENSEKAVSEKIVSEQSDFGKLTSENEISGDVVSQQEKTAQTIEAIDAADPVKTAGTANSGAETKVQIDNDASETVQKNAVADFVKDIVDEAKKSVSASVEIGNEEKSENLESESDACDGAESEKPNRRKRRRGKSSAVLAKTLFDKVATPERKAQVESLTDTAKTALGAVLETASEMIAEQIAEKNSEKNSEKNTEKNAEKNAGKKTEKKVEKSAEKSVEENTQKAEKAEKKTEKNAGKSAERHTKKLAETKSEPAPECAVTKPDFEETLKKTENKTEESVIEYPELEDERDLNYDPDEDQDEDSENRKNAENLENAKKSELAEKQGESEASEEIEAQRLASYTPCQRSVLRIFRASGSTDPHQDLKFFMDICGTVKLSNMSMVHNMLEYQFGQAVGNSLYRYLKENPECKEELSAGYSNRRKQREREYLDLILKRNQIEIQEEATETIWKILSGLPRKNLSGIHTALVKKFGQEIGSGYYAVLRNHVKIIRNL